MSVIAFGGSVGPIPIDVVLQEDHTTEIEITEIPIETGAKINDHAYILPKKLTLQIADGAGAATFNAIVALQEQRTPFVVVSGLFVYSNMLVKKNSATRDPMHHRILKGTVDLQETIIVSTASAAVSADGTSTPTGGNPGGAASTTQANPTVGDIADPVSVDRVTPAVPRGDTVTSTVQSGTSSSIAVDVWGW